MVEQRVITAVVGERYQQTLVLVGIASVLWLLYGQLEHNLGVVLHIYCVGLFGSHVFVFGGFGGSVDV